MNPPILTNFTLGSRFEFERLMVFIIENEGHTHQLPKLAKTAGRVRIPNMTTLPYQRPGLAKRRSRRLRKKLHIAEFQELGFDYEITWHSGPTLEQQDAFLGAWIALVASRALVLGGGPTSGFLCGVRRNPNPADIQAVHDFLSAWAGIERFTIGKMIDGWYEEPFGHPS